MTRTTNFKLLLIVWLAGAGFMAYRGWQAEQFDQLRLPMSALNNPKDPFWRAKPMPPEEIDADIQMPPTMASN
jgi:hypothetical protein